ncbi:MAG: transposase [Gammaproteobacteria bacterium]
MPRRPRYELTTVPQHVIQRGNNQQPTFFSEEDYHRYLGCLREAAIRRRCDIHAYVLMSNHVHLLVTPHRPLAIAKLMQSVGRHYVRYVNDHYGRSGTLWEGRYKASLVDSEHYLLRCYRYIEINPVRAGTVSHPADYRWSSYRRNALGGADAVVTEHAEYTALGASLATRCEAYRALFRVDLDVEVLGEIRDSLNQCRVLGSERFKDEIEAALHRKVRAGKAGRPSKMAGDKES